MSKVSTALHGHATLIDFLVESAFFIQPSEYLPNQPDAIHPLPRHLELMASRVSWRYFKRMDY